MTVRSPQLVPFRQAVWLRVLQRAALGVWLSIPVLGLLAQPLAGRLVWTVAVAGLPLFIVLVGYHRWRIICPLAWFNQLPVRLGRGGHWRMPAWVEQHYYYIPLGAFTCGLWLRLIWTNGDGIAIALFFVGLSAVAAVFGAITTGKTWCNYLCPVSFIEKVYTEPTGLRQTENSQCSPCTACKRACPDINQENAYWKEIDLPSKRVAYFAYPGLIFGFYLYYFLQSGTWDYYFGGAWTDEPGVVLHAFAPGFNADTAGFFFLPLVPRAVAALVTLLGCAAISWLIFSRGVVRLVDGWISRRQLAVDRRNVVLTITAFTAFVTFYSFAGQPTLRKVDSLPTLAAIVTICVATLSLVRRFGRTQTAFAEQAVARNLLKLPEMKYADLLQAYRESVQESLAEGLVTRAEVQRLTALRDRLKIRTADHERIMRELALTESSLTSSALAAFPEKRLQLAAYARAIQVHVERLRDADAATEIAVGELQARYGVSPTEHAAVLSDLLEHSRPTAEAVSALAQRVREIDVALTALRALRSPAVEFLRTLLIARRKRAIAQVAELIPDRPDQFAPGCHQLEEPSIETCLRWQLSDRDPYVRAAAVAAWRDCELDEEELARTLAPEEDEMVRETAASGGLPGTLDKMLTLRTASLFHHLDPVSLATLARASAYAHFLPGEDLCVQGEPAEDVLVLMSGAADVIEGDGASTRIVRIQGPGDVIGEMAILDPAPRSATVRARADGAAVLRVDGDVFRDAVAHDAHVAKSLIQMLVRRLRSRLPDQLKEAIHT